MELAARSKPRPPDDLNLGVRNRQNTRRSESHDDIPVGRVHDEAMNKVGIENGLPGTAAVAVAFPRPFCLRRLAFTLSRRASWRAVGGAGGTTTPCPTEVLDTSGCETARDSAAVVSPLCCSCTFPLTAANLLRDVGPVTGSILTAHSSATRFASSCRPFLPDPGCDLVFWASRDCCCLPLPATKSGCWSRQHHWDSLPLPAQKVRCMHAYMHAYV